jgi:hypothetical protein
MVPKLGIDERAQKAANEPFGPFRCGTAPFSAAAVLGVLYCEDAPSV